MAGPDPNRPQPPDDKRTLSGKLTLLAIGCVILAYIITIVAGVSGGGGG